MTTRKRVLGEDHLEIATAMNNLALTYWTQKRMDEAKDLELQVLWDMQWKTTQWRGHNGGITMRQIPTSRGYI